MSDQEQRIQQLRTQIEAAWADVPYPGDDQIAADPHHCFECEDVQEYFAGKDWKELPAPGEEIFPCVDTHLLTGAAWHYYLPMYLIDFLTGKRDNGFDYHLIQPTRDIDGSWKDRTCRFSRRQCDAVAAVLDFALSDGSLADCEIQEYVDARDVWRSPPPDFFEPPPPETYGMPGYPRSERS